MIRRFPRSVPAPPRLVRSTRYHEPRLSIIIPTLNEARNLEHVLPELPDAFEVIVVDGNSTDGTVDVARRILPDVKIIKQTRKGKGNALACGFGAATGDIVVMFDADGSADPAEIPRFVAALVAGADFAKGSRFAHGGGSDDITVIRRMGNYFLNTSTNVLFGTRFSDLCYGYNAFWRDVVPVLDLPSPQLQTTETMVWGDGFEIETVINCRVAAGGLTISEVGSVERPRVFGESNLSAVKDGLRVLKTIGSERQRAWRIARQTKASRTATATAKRDVVSIPRPRETPHVIDLTERQSRLAEESA